MHSTQNLSRLGARRKSCVSLAALLLASGAHAQAPVAAYPAYPDKPVRIVVAFAAGGSTDTIARGLGRHLANKLKQSFVIDNKPNIGTTSHLSGFMLARRAGFKAIHVPYKGVDALNDWLIGRLQFMFATIPSVIQHVQAGRLRAIAVTSKPRSRSLPAMQAQMIREGADPVGGTPVMLGQFTQKEFEKWRALVRESGATVE